MPKLEPKLIQKELDQGKVRPVYWIYGPERMKSRELMKRIQKAVLQDQTPNDFNFEKIDGSEVNMDGVIDSAQGFSLMGGTKFMVIRNAEEIKNLDPMMAWLKELEVSDPSPPETFQSVCIFLSKNFDARKKASKVIQEIAAVVPCEEVSEADRAPWIDSLAKRKKITLSESEQNLLRGLEPWSLEIVDQELSKIELVADDEKLRSEVILSGVDARARDEFIDAIFCRNEARGFKVIHLFCEEMEVQLPILGLVSWNLRHLKLYLMEQETKTRSPEKRNPYLLKNLDRWKPHWTVKKIQALEHQLFEIDFALKNTRLLGRGLWSKLFMKEGLS